MKSSVRGLTLMEVLVVLVIAGMASTILLQALSQVYKVQARFGVQLTQSRQGVMQSAWFRQLVQGLQTDLASSPQTFKGSANEMSGSTTGGLLSSEGAPSRMVLRIKSDERADETKLMYSDDTEKPLMLLNLSGRNAAKFVYLDAKGEQHDQWPPAMGDWPQLPSVVMLMVRNDGSHLIVAAPRGSSEAKVMPFQLGSPQ